MGTERSPAQVSIQLQSSRPSTVLGWVVGGVLGSSHFYNPHHATCAVLQEGGLGAARVFQLFR